MPVVGVDGRIVYRVNFYLLDVRYIAVGEDVVIMKFKTISGGKALESEVLFDRVPIASENTHDSYATLKVIVNYFPSLNSFSAFFRSLCALASAILASKANSF